MHNLKLESYVIFGKLAEDLSLGGRLSDCSKEAREGPGCIEVSATKTS